MKGHWEITKFTASTPQKFGGDWEPFAVVVDEFNTKWVYVRRFIEDKGDA